MGGPASTTPAASCDQEPVRIPAAICETFCPPPGSFIPEQTTPSAAILFEEDPVYQFLQKYAASNRQAGRRWGDGWEGLFRRIKAGECQRWEGSSVIPDVPIPPVPGLPDSTVDLWPQEPAAIEFCPPPDAPSADEETIVSDILAAKACFFAERKAARLQIHYESGRFRIPRRHPKVFMNWQGHYYEAKLAADTYRAICKTAEPAAGDFNSIVQEVLDLPTRKTAIWQMLQNEEKRIAGEMTAADFAGRLAEAGAREAIQDEAERWAKKAKRGPGLRLTVLSFMAGLLVDWLLEEHILPREVRQFRSLVQARQTAFQNLRDNYPAVTYSCICAGKITPLEGGLPGDAAGAVARFQERLGKLEAGNYQPGLRQWRYETTNLFDWEEEPCPPACLAEGFQPITRGYDRNQVRRFYTRAIRSAGSVRQPVPLVQEIGTSMLARGFEEREVRRLLQSQTPLRRRDLDRTLQSCCWAARRAAPQPRSKRNPQATEQWVAQFLRQELEVFRLAAAENNWVAARQRVSQVAHLAIFAGQDDARRLALNRAVAMAGQIRSPEEKGRAYLTIAEAIAHFPLVGGEVIPHKPSRDEIAALLRKYSQGRGCRSARPPSNPWPPKTLCGHVAKTTVEASGADDEPVPVGLVIDHDPVCKLEWIEALALAAVRPSNLHLIRAGGQVADTLRGASRQTAYRFLTNALCALQKK